MQRCAAGAVERVERNCGSRAFRYGSVGELGML